MIQQHVPPGFYEEVVKRVLSSRSRRFRKLKAYGNPNSASTMAWMVENGRGIRAFAEYPPGTFETVIRNEVEVWFRQA